MFKDITFSSHLQYVYFLKYIISITSTLFKVCWSVLVFQKGLHRWIKIKSKSGNWIESGNLYDSQTWMKVDISKPEAETKGNAN